MCHEPEHAEGIDIALRLAATADVVTSNYTPDRLDRWGLGYDALRAVNPDIILANLAVMGIDGPNMGWRSYGSGVVAMCGIGALTGFPDRDPIGIGTLHTDFTVPYFAATAIMAASISTRARRGQYRAFAGLSLNQMLDTESSLPRRTEAARRKPIRAWCPGGHPRPGVPAGSPSRPSDAIGTALRPWE